MAKQDETPIEFYVPGPGRRPILPEPVNQPHWRYLRRPPLTNFGKSVTLFLIVISIVGIAAIFYGLSGSELTPVQGIFIFLGMTLMIAGIMTSISDLLRPSPPPEHSHEPGNERRKKLPRRRKDYH